MSDFILNRRKLIGGLVAFIAAPAIIRVADLMPIRAFTVEEALYRGIRYQDWPLGTERPYYHGHGEISRASNKTMPESYWLNELKRFSAWERKLHYEFIS